MPPIQRSGEIDFYIFKSMPYYPRLYLSMGLFLLGLGLQVILLSVFPGVYFIWGAMLVGVAKGYRSTAEPLGSTFWKEVDWSGFEEISNISERNKRWDTTWLDITNSRGLILFLVVGTQAIWVYYWLFPEMERTGLIYATDVFSVAVPLWFTGTRRVLTNDKLVVKVEEFLAIRKKYEPLLIQNGDTFIPLMETVPAKGGDKEIPTDVQLRVRFKEMEKDFHGLQAQVTINEVQGMSHPYFYCVLVAATGAVKWREFRKPAGNRKILVELQQQRDVEVLVIRQKTTKKSGYNVDRKTAAKIFQLAYERGGRINKTSSASPQTA
jgi:hypothetical protein